MVTKEEKKKKNLLLQQRKAALQAEIGRKKLLQAVIAKKRVNVLAKVEDKIPSLFINGEGRSPQPEKSKLSFLGKSRIL